MAEQQKAIVPPVEIKAIPTTEGTAQASQGSGKTSVNVKSALEIVNKAKGGG